MSYNGVDYTLQDIVFHHKSETLIAGVQYPLEMQATHASSDGKMLVVSVLFQYGENHKVKENLALDKLNWTNNARMIPGQNDTVPGFNMSELLPESGFFSLAGARMIVSSPPLQTIS